MQTKKMSLAKIKGALSRAEMKKIMAGSGTGYCRGECHGSVGSWIYTTPGGTHYASCNYDIRLYCSSGAGFCYTC